MNLFNNFINNRIFPWSNAEENSVEFLKSKPPINSVVEPIRAEGENLSDIKGEVSIDKINVENVERNIGNLSIIAKELNEGGGNGIDLVIVMDVSGSMSCVAKDCIKILKYAVECLSSTDRLSIITFDSEARHLFPLQPMIGSVKSDLKNIIEKCFTGGSTNLASALDLLIRVKKDGMIDNRPFKVIILSDGQPDSGCEGFNLVERIYEGEVKPEVFACTFGGNVKADTLIRLLLPNNQHYYKHIASMEEFKSLVTELGLDKNIVLATNLLIKLKGAKPLSDIATMTKEADEYIYEIRINQIKTGDIFTTAFDYESKFDVAVSYVDKNNNRVNMEIKEVEGLDSFVKNHYWYKSLSEMIKDIANTRQNVNEVENKNSKIVRLNYITTLATKENLGEFYDDVKDLIEKTRVMLNNVDNGYDTYNRYSQQMSNISSYATPMVKKAYKKYTK